jgi:hypothetical protein
VYGPKDPDLSQNVKDPEYRFQVRIPFLPGCNVLATARAPRVRNLACNIIPDSAGICDDRYPVPF